MCHIDMCASARVRAPYTTDSAVQILVTCTRVFAKDARHACMLICERCCLNRMCRNHTPATRMAEVKC